MVLSSRTLHSLLLNQPNFWCCYQTNIWKRYCWSWNNISWSFIWAPPGPTTDNTSLIYCNTTQTLHLSTVLAEVRAKFVSLNGYRPTWLVTWLEEPAVLAATRSRSWWDRGCPPVSPGHSLQPWVKVAATYCVAKLYPRTLPDQPRVSHSSLQLTAQQAMLSLR